MLPSSPPTKKKTFNRRQRGARGAVIVEYAFLLTAFAIPAIMGIVAGGVAMLKDYQDAKTQLLRPMP
jgi:hypothetical protein